MSIYSRIPNRFYRCNDGAYSDHNRKGACNWHGGLKSLKPVRTQKSGSGQRMKSGDVVNVPVQAISVRHEWFQGRATPYSIRSVENIFAAVRENKFRWVNMDPVTLWAAPGGKLYMLSGHSRLEAFTQLCKANASAEGKSFCNIPAKIIADITLEEAKKIALQSNTLSTKETPLERAAYYAQLRRNNVDPATIKAQAKRLEGRNYIAVLAYSYLSPTGKTLNALQALENGDADSNNIMTSVARWIGNARQSYLLTNTHEDELYDWLITRRGYGSGTAQVSNEREFKSRLSSIINRRTTFGKLEERLNIQSFLQRSPVEQQYDQQLQAAKQAVLDAEKGLKSKIKELTNKGASENQIKRITEGLEAAVRRSRIEYQTLLSNKSKVAEAARNELSLFSALGAIVDNKPPGVTRCMDGQWSTYILGRGVCSYHGGATQKKHSGSKPQKTIVFDTVPKSDYITSAISPTLSVKAIKEGNIWYVQQEFSYFAFSAKSHFGKEGSEYAASVVHIVKNAKEAGFKEGHYLMSGRGGIRVLEKDGNILTKKGAQQILDITNYLPLSDTVKHQACKLPSHSTFLATSDYVQQKLKAANVKFYYKTEKTGVIPVYWDIDTRLPVGEDTLRLAIMNGAGGVGHKTYGIRLFGLPGRTKDYSCLEVDQAIADFISQYNELKAKKIVVTRENFNQQRYGLTQLSSKLKKHLSKYFPNVRVYIEKGGATTSDYIVIDHNRLEVLQHIGKELFNKCVPSSEYWRPKLTNISSVKPIYLNPREVYLFLFCKGDLSNKTQDIKPQKPNLEEVELKNYYIINENQKYQLHFDYRDYQALPKDQKREVKKYFLWSRARKAWISKGKEGNYAARLIIQKLGLQQKGRMKRKSFADAMEDKQNRAEYRAGRLEQRSLKADKRAEALQADFNKYRKDWSWLTQPNVNTSGGRRFSRHRDRVMNRYDKGMKERIYSQQLAERAADVRSRLENPKDENITYVLRRIKDGQKIVNQRQKDVQRVINVIEKYEKTGQKPEYPTDWSIEKVYDALERIKGDLDFQTDKLAYYLTKKQELEDAGVIVWAKEDLKGAEYIKIDLGWYKVVRVNPTTVTHSWFVGTWKSPHGEIQDVIFKGDQYTVHPGSVKGQFVVKRESNVSGFAAKMLSI